MTISNRFGIPCAPPYNGMKRMLRDGRVGITNLSQLFNEKECILCIHSLIRAALIVEEDRIADLPAILHSVSPQRIQSMLRQGRFYWQKYFKTVKDITLTTLQVINDRVFPYTGKNYDYWNEPTPKVKCMQVIRLFEREN